MHLTGRPATVLHGVDERPAHPPIGSTSVPSATSEISKALPKAFCPYCDKYDHYLSQCPTFKSFNKQQITDWIQTNLRCWRCGRTHQASKCTLKKPCSICKGRHLQILHEVNFKTTTEGSCLINSATETLYLDRPTGCREVLLKVVRVLLRHKDKTLDTYAVLDDGSERTILLSSAASKLGIHGTMESLTLRTIRQDVQTVTGVLVSFQISPATEGLQNLSCFHCGTSRPSRAILPFEYSGEVPAPQGRMSGRCCPSGLRAAHAVPHSPFNNMWHCTATLERRFSVDKCFYVDNCLQSLPSVEEARQLVDKLRALLSSGGFRHQTVGQ